MISLLLPTRGRPAQARRFLASVVDRCHRPDDVEVVLYIDDDDTESHALEHPRVRTRRIIGTDTAMGTFNTRCLAAASGSILMLVNDDVVVRTDGWDERLREVDRRHPDGIYLAYPNDQFKGRRVAAFPILSRRTCELLERPYPVEYRGSMIDYHILDLFRRLAHLGSNRICYLEDVVFEHRHYRTGKSEFDHTYRRRSRFGDDEVFIALRRQRQSAAERLAAAIVGTVTPALAAASCVRTPGRWLPETFRYARVFLGDRGLPLPWGTFLFAWYCARHLAAHGLGAPVAPGPDRVLAPHQERIVDR